MSKPVCFIITATSAILGASILTAGRGIAAPETKSVERGNWKQDETLVAQAIPEYASPQEALGVIRNRPKIRIPGSSSQSPPLPQVTNVSELRDVEPTSWAYEALRSLVERYGCLVGYPDRTFRGNKALSRWEFDD